MSPTRDILLGAQSTLPSNSDSASQSFRAFPYEDMPLMAQSPTIFSTVSRKEAKGKGKEVKTEEKEDINTSPDFLACHSDPVTTTNNDNAPPATTGTRGTWPRNSSANAISRQAASGFNSLHPPTVSTRSRAAFPSVVGHSPMVTTSNAAARSTRENPEIPCPFASQTSTEDHFNRGANDAREPTISERLRTVSAGNILTTLIHSQVNLPTKAVILATGNPLGMVLPDGRQFVLMGGLIRNGRVIEGRVVQVTAKVFEEHMAREYEKAFVNGVEELVCPITEPLVSTRFVGAPKPTLREIRVAVAMEVGGALDEAVEVIMTDLIEKAVASAAEGPPVEKEMVDGGPTLKEDCVDEESTVENVLPIVVEQAVASRVEEPVLVRDMVLEDPFVTDP